MTHGDRGFTVIEMLVTVTLTGIVGALTTTVIVQGFHQQQATDARAAAVANVRTALERTMRDLRGAEITSMTPTSVDLTEYASGGTRQVSYQLQTANGSTSLAVSVNSAPATVLLTNIANDLNDPAQQVFTPAPILPSYTPTVAGTVDTSSCAYIGVSPTQYAPDCVGTVTVHLRVMPVDHAGRQLCDSNGQCVIDVSDDAGIRNNP